MLSSPPMFQWTRCGHHLTFRSGDLFSASKVLRGASSSRVGVIIIVAKSRRRRLGSRHQRRRSAVDLPSATAERFRVAPSTQRLFTRSKALWYRIIKRRRSSNSSSRSARKRRGTCRTIPGCPYSLPQRYVPTDPRRLRGVCSDVCSKTC